MRFLAALPRASPVTNSASFIVSGVLHADFATSFLAFTALVNLHHFILDGSIWKLRDSRIASLLLNERSSGKEVADSSHNSIAGAFHWLPGTSPLARVLRIDQSSGEALGTAADWFNYRKFLHRQKQSEQLVFACLLMAEE